MTDYQQARIEASNAAYKTAIGLAESLKSSTPAMTASEFAEKLQKTMGGINKSQAETWSDLITARDTALLAEKDKEIERLRSLLKVYIYNNCNYSEQCRHLNQAIIRKNAAIKRLKAVPSGEATKKKESL